jgi:hypothetical protein
MAERAQDRGNFPSSPACGQWETLLVDAMDGALRPEDEATFSNHMATCSACTEMFEQVRRGREWLEFLAPEPEVPADLLARILTETGNGKMEPGRLVIAGAPGEAAGNLVTMAPVWQRPGFAARLRRFAEPRLLMTAAMAFFSIALTLSMTGVRFSVIRLSDLRPAALRSVVEKRIMTASTPLVRYYDHLRFVYEVESRMRELRRQTDTPGDKSNTPNSTGTQPTGTGGQGESHRKDGGTKLNPNAAPQQTVNPPVSLWSSDTLEAELQLPALATPSNILSTTGGNTRTPSSGRPYLEAVAVANRAQTRTQGKVEGTPERSNTCLA